MLLPSSGAVMANDREARERDRAVVVIGAVISGVPVLARPRIQREVVGPAFRLMAPGGFFTPITYSPGTPVSEALQRELGLSVTRLGTVWGNLPPARVFAFRRRAH